MLDFCSFLASKQKVKWPYQLYTSLRLKSYLTIPCKVTSCCVLTIDWGTFKYSLYGQFRLLCSPKCIIHIVMEVRYVSNQMSHVIMGYQMSYVMVKFQYCKYDNYCVVGEKITATLVCCHLHLFVGESVVTSGKQNSYWNKLPDISAHTVPYALMRYRITSSRRKWRQRGRGRGWGGSSSSPSHTTSPTTSWGRLK